MFFLCNSHKFSTLFFIILTSSVFPNRILLKKIKKAISSNAEAHCFTRAFTELLPFHFPQYSLGKKKKIHNDTQTQIW